ncbi:hypothetical protein G9A89_019539 [Geosiphon pyriformis]|nr:hypothetical protein G9A89_019539 [Geosiphon pyriformis]
MLAGSTSWKFSVLQSYLIKAVHHQLLMAIQKRLYDKSYSGVLCLLCKEVELLNYVFSCAMDAGVQDEILAKAAASWVFLMSSHVLSSSAVLQFLGCCFSNCSEAVEVFEVRKMAVSVVVNFVRSVVELHHSRVWLVRSGYKISIEKTGLVENDRVISGLSHCKIFMLGVLGSFSVSFGCHRPKLFFFGLDFSPQVIIDV